MKTRTQKINVVIRSRQEAHAALAAAMELCSAVLAAKLGGQFEMTPREVALLGEARGDLNALLDQIELPPKK